MATHISHSSLPYPIKNARYTLLVPYLDADGDPTDPTTPDTEVSQDGGAFADAAEEVTTITGSNGMGYVTLTGAETNNSAVGVAFKVASGPKNTLATIYPRNLPILESGTASAGAAGTITLASGTYTGLSLAGCFIRTTGGTGGGGTGGADNQARRITAYNTSTRVATVAPNWETTPDATTTYDVLLPEGVLVPMLTALAPTTFARTLDVSSTGEAGVDWANVGSPTTTLALTGTTIATTQKVDVETIKTQTVTCAAGVTVGVYVGGTGAAALETTAQSILTDTAEIGAAGAGLTALGDTRLANLDATVSSRSTLTQTQVTGGAYALNSASFGFNAALDFTTTQKAATLARVTLVDTVTTLTGHTPQTGDSYAIVNSGTHGNAALKTLIDTVDNFVDTEITTIITHLTDIKGATWTTTDTLEAIRDRGDAAWITATGFSTHSAADVITAMGTGAFLSAIPWNAAWDAEVQSEVQDAIEVNHLDHLLAADYDPASKPGVSTALLNELIGNDLGVSQFTANALELGPTGSALDAAGVRAAVGLASANLDTQLDALPTNAELATALGTADDAVLAAIAALNDLSSAEAQTAAVAALSVALTEAYRSTGSTGSVAQLLYEIIAHLGESSISSTTKTLKKLDGSTTAKTYTLDDATNPTSITETT